MGYVSLKANPKSKGQILKLTYDGLKPIEGSPAYFIVYFKTFKTVFTVIS